MSSRQRHPSARWRPDLDGLRQRLEAELRSRDSPWPDVGAAALLARGVAGERRETWAAGIGIDPAVVTRAEAGDVPADALPAALRRRLALVEEEPRGDTADGYCPPP